MSIFINEKEIKKIISEHIDKIHSIEEKTTILLKEQISNLMSRVLLHINQSLKNKDQSKKNDTLYYYVLDSKKLYKDYIEMVNEKEALFSTPVVREVFLEIKTIFQEELGSIQEPLDNPITYERMVIINAGILKIKQYLEQQFENSKKRCTIGNHITKAQMFNYMKGYVTEFFEEILPGINGCIEEVIGKLAEQKEAIMYKKYLNNQKIMITGLMEINKAIISENITGNDEGLFVGKLFGIIEELYEITISKKEQVDKVADYKVTAKDMVSMAVIEDIVENNLLANNDESRGFLDSIEENREDSKDKLVIIILDELLNLNQQIIREIKKESIPYKLLSYQIIESLGKAVEQLDVVDIDYKTDEGKRIVKGIIDTMMLKYESLKEKDIDYHINKKDLNILQEKQLLDLRNSFIKHSKNILDEVIEGLYNSMLIMESLYNKKIENIKISHFKQDMTYLRTELLFELRTFEEIVEYSLKKLIEIEMEVVDPIVEIMEKTVKDTRKALEMIDIVFIEPKSHDKFNGKIHEIMLAEVEDGFSKGEIIKCSGIGYSINEQVILRANVIAAR